MFGLFGADDEPEVTIKQTPSGIEVSVTGTSQDETGDVMDIANRQFSSLAADSVSVQENAITLRQDDDGVYRQ
ncbi:hypothetical protein B2G88_12115 [Natronolimnobius baerhuensis]|uniref:Uncharacterized protein n=1 Tax=Natronolimnobius baerhuensis TaxID=253108 RepID=A0A202EA36_9EURY|nr:hypothetical protein B2G88_12115 [Natronolimnobius baerhuensis]